MTNEELAVKIKEGDTALMPTLWKQVELFVNQQSKIFYNRYTEQCRKAAIGEDDLFQEGYLSICEALKRYNANRSVKFLTYARYWIIEYFYKAAKIKTKQLKLLRLDDTVRIKDGKAQILTDIIASETAQDDFDNLENNDYMNTVVTILRQELNKLTPTQREALIVCVGNCVSYSEYARRKGVTRASTKQAVSRALHNLRAISELTAYMV